MDPVDDLVVWLRAQLDEDELAALRSIGGDLAERGEASVWEHDGDRTVRFGQVVVAQDPPDGYPRNGRHIAEHDPARVLREVEAKRAVLDLVRLDFDSEGKPIFIGGYGEAYWDVVRLLALPYSDRLGYQEAWRPA